MSSNNSHIPSDDQGTGSKQRPTGMGAAAVILALASAVSYLIGLFRDRVFAHVYGVSPELDAYYAAFIIPDLLFNLFIAGITSHAVFVPVLSQYIQRGERQRAWDVANSFLNVATGIITVMSIVGFFLMPTLFHYIAPGFTGEQYELGVKLTRILLLQPIIFGISNTFGSILVTQKRFLGYACAPALYNLGIMATTLLFYREHGIYAAAYGILFGAVLHLAIRFWDLYTTPYRYRWRWGVRDRGFHTMLKLAVPKAIGLLVGQANLYAYTYIGSLMAVGTIAVFNYARNLQSFPVSLVGIAMATAALPTLSDAAQSNDKEKFTRHLDQAARYILFLSLPATAGMIILATEIVSLILRTGAFDPSAIDKTVPVLIFLALAITFENMKHLLARGFYAYQDTMSPVGIAIVAIIVNVFISWSFRDTLGVAAFGVGFLAGEFLQVIFLQWKLQSLFAPTGHRLLASLLKISAATLIMSGMTIGAKIMLSGYPSQAVAIVCLLVGTVSYLGSAWFMRIEELAVVPAIMKKILRRA